MRNMLLISAGAIALACGGTAANAETISNPGNSYPFFGPLCADGAGGGCQTQGLGETFTASTSGQLTNLQFTLNGSSLSSLYAAVYTWTGTSLGTELWRSGNVAGTPGLLSFDPTGVAVTAGQTYVAFLSTYGIAGNSGQAYVGACYGCASAVAGLGSVYQLFVYGDGAREDRIGLGGTADLTFSATITPAAVPEAATWAMMIAGFAAIGTSMRRRRIAVSFA